MYVSSQTNTVQVSGQAQIALGVIRGQTGRYRDLAHKAKKLDNVPSVP
jgi:hypothetical protein